MDEFNYTLECPSCDCKVDIRVRFEDELPCFCPMCGEDCNEIWAVTD
jgi:hypothetical protein